MPPLFTRFVLSCAEAPDEQLALAVWERLREILEHELKRRGLWLSPPSYLGIYGWPNWAGPAGEPAAALEELVAECYAFIFVDRLGRLQAQLQAKPNIEGLVLLNVRHFFLERQKEHDPLGFRVFEMLRAAVREAIAAGEIFVLAGDPEVRNGTLLGFAATAPAEALPTRLGPLLAHWNDELLPDLVLARGRRQGAVWRKLRDLLRGLERHGIAAFRFRDVLDPLKSDTRRRWAALLEESAEEGAAEGVAASRAPRAVLPDTPFESRQSLEKLTRYVSAALRRSPLEARTREYLALLWQYLRLATGTAEEGDAAERLAADLAEEERLSHRRLAQVLGIPRERLPGLFATLRQWVAEAQAKARAGRPASPAPQPPAPVLFHPRRQVGPPLAETELEGAG
jgi:hypothetical protein